MNNQRNQLGVGLIEVLVALLVLAIGVLGFIALQYRAVEASTESENRIQALNIARDLAEKIRVNRTALDTYTTVAARNDITTLPTPNCFNTECTPVQKATFDASWSKLNAQRFGMTINMMTCPGVSNGRRCVYVAWGETSATDADGLNNCTTSGAYRNESTCVVLETY